MAKKYTTFPQLVFVIVEDDGDDDFMLVSGDKAEALGSDEVKRVGVYKFIEVHEVRKADPHWKKARSRKTH